MKFLRALQEETVRNIEVKEQMRVENNKEKSQ